MKTYTQEVYDFVRQRCKDKEAILLTTEGQGKTRRWKETKDLLWKYKYSDFKWKEIVPLNAFDYKKATEFMVIM